MSTRAGARGARTALAVGLAALLGVAMVLTVLNVADSLRGWFHRGAPSSVATPPAEAPPAPVVEPPAPAAPVEPAPGLPPLAESDPWIRSEARALSSHAKLAAWLGTEGLIQRFAVLVDNLAEGADPARHVPFLAPEEAFRPERQGDRLVLGPSSYRRFDVLGDVVASLDARAAAALYRTVKPLLQEAYRQLGYPDRDFDVALARAIALVRDTPVIEGDVELAPSVRTYRFQDPALEGLRKPQKDLIRMGPANQRKIQQKLEEIAELLGLPKV
jgi:hypothetical protein